MKAPAGSAFELRKLPEQQQQYILHQIAGVGLGNAIAP